MEKGIGVVTSIYESLGLGAKGVVSLVGAGGKTSLMFRLAHELSTDHGPVLTTTTTKIYPPTIEQTKSLIINPSPADMLVAARNQLKRYRHVTATVRHDIERGKLIGYPTDDIELIWKSALFHWIIIEADGAARNSLKAPAPHEPVIPGCTDIVVGVVGLSALNQPLTKNTVFRHERFSRITGLKEGDIISVKALGDLLIHPQGLFQGAPLRAKRIVFLNQADLPGKASLGNSAIQHLSGRANLDVERVILGSMLADPPVLGYQLLCQ